ncbi:amidohydrolase family protein, partial [Cupriavidus sp. WS]|uniref:amidohydrolase family protein n=1 Tax=Cupriavidus sp. WS TaxID=1312922 RepID=UPI00048A9E12
MPASTDTPPSGLPPFDTLIRGATVLDGSGAEARRADVALRAGRIARIAMLDDDEDGGGLDPAGAAQVVAADGLVLAPGFIDVHTHDDTNVVRQPQMTPKLSQGVTTVIVGNCGISAAPVALRGEPPDPMNLLGGAEAFRYPDFGSYVQAVRDARPAVNVAALVGHTALRSNHMDRLDRAAT